MLLSTVASHGDPVNRPFEHKGFEARGFTVEKNTSGKMNQRGKTIGTLDEGHGRPHRITHKANILFHLKNLGLYIGLAPNNVDDMIQFWICR